MNDELYHHGILGMHWGVRRYQNEDGSLTDAGKRRYDKEQIRESNRQREWNARNTSQLSDEELTRQILRLQREKQLKDLTSQVVSPGKKHARDLLERYGDQAIGAIVTAGITAGVTSRVNKKLKPKEKSAYDRMKEDLNAKTQLADEGFPVNVKGYKRKDGEWVPKD